ncbi:cation diffusion facilitator family transporter [Apiospora aurea]|uniref:Cation diffusion facilitator family transporter n=1 Tax=Apiospora aurea TaxID=335848 RepID=A0ABR1QQH4_9PEZI
MAWSKSMRIGIMLAIDIVFFLIELISGFFVGSLALQADAFHMLNDIISLLVGLWAVTVAKRATTDKFSYGWVRAEILGAFFNAVFLIALCVSVILEAMTRLIDPPTIEQPKLILIVGCTGLASNLIGFFVLGGHGHSHGPGDHSHGGHEHSHDHDNAHAAEEGRVDHADTHVADEAGPAMDALPHVALARAANGNDSPETVRRINFAADSDAAERGDSRSSGLKLDGRHRAGSLKHTRLQSIDDLNLYPSSFRQNIIDRSRSNMEKSEGSSVDGSSTVNDEAPVDENSPLVVKNGKGGSVSPHSGDGAGENGQRKGHSSSRQPRGRRDSVGHHEHNHNKPRKPGKKGHGHNHDDMGMNAMVLHVIGDALGNVGVIVTALIIWLTDWPGKYYADPAVSLFITFIILRSAIPLTLATSNILLQATPDQIDIKDIKEDIQALPGVISCHHVHVWQLSDTKIVASMHIQVAFPITEAGGEKYMALAKSARKCLHAYSIHSATIQPEFCLDESCNHLDVSMSTDGTLDGQALAANCANGESPPCLLECVDDCVGQGCCSVPPSQNGDAGSHKSGHSGHSHSNGHDHDHDHGHDHEHGHEHRH